MEEQDEGQSAERSMINGIQSERKGSWIMQQERLRRDFHSNFDLDFSTYQSHRNLYAIIPSSSADICAIRSRYSVWREKERL